MDGHNQQVYPTSCACVHETITETNKRITYPSAALSDIPMWSQSTLHSPSAMETNNTGIIVMANSRTDTAKPFLTTKDSIIWQLQASIVYNLLPWQHISLKEKSFKMKRCMPQKMKGGYKSEGKDTKPFLHLSQQSEDIGMGIIVFL